MSKTLEEMAEEWANQEVPQYHHIDCTPMDRYAHKKAERGFLAGYKAAQAIVEEELQAVQAQRAEYPGLGAAQYALKNVLAKMGSK